VEICETLVTKRETDSVHVPVCVTVLRVYSILVTSLSPLCSREHVGVIKVTMIERFY